MTRAARRVVVTGVGLVCPLGNTKDALWESLSGGRSGVAPLEVAAAETLPVGFGAAARQFTGKIDDFGPLPKQRKKAIRKGLADDIVLLSGGESMGNYDLVPKALELFGAKTVFHKVRQKPGKPLYFGKRDRQLVFGLPGNPLSVMTGFYEFALPAVRRLSGVEPKLCQVSLHLPLAGEVVGLAQLVRYVLAKLVYNKKGTSVRPVKSHGSGDLISGGNADGVIVLPKKAGKISAPSVVAFRPWRPLP